MIGERYLEQRSALTAVLGSLIALAQQTHAPPEIPQHLRDLLSSLSDPLTLVVVGEVKAGKSSLLNALFGHEFCKADVLPATDKVYVFKYGAPPRDIPVSEHLTERYMPVKFLRDFQVVDTPGTNTIVAHHQAITENFIPVADLILFVFSITNPWAASAWDMLRLIGQQWRKNLVFILQQADLRDPAEVATIIRYLEQTTLQILGSRHPVFAVSAKKAREAKLSGQPHGEHDGRGRLVPGRDHHLHPVGRPRRQAGETVRAVRRRRGREVHGVAEVVGAGQVDGPTDERRLAGVDEAIAVVVPPRDTRQRGRREAEHRVA